MKTIRLITAALLIASGFGFAGFTSGCASTATRKSTGEFIDDATITTKVKAAFFQDPVVSVLDVGVDTYKGWVQLNGFVDTPEQKSRAELIARRVPGVTQVANKLSIKGQASQ